MITPFALSILLLITEKDEHFLALFNALYSSTSQLQENFSLSGALFETRILSSLSRDRFLISNCSPATSLLKKRKTATAVWYKPILGVYLRFIAIV
jgi:hypothetical protein